MSNSSKITEWKKKSDIDYFPLFMSLWLAFDAWLQYRFSNTSQRQNLETLKEDRRNVVYITMKEILINDEKNAQPKSLIFKNNLSELKIAMSRAHIHYSDYEQDAGKTKVLSFSDSLIKRKNTKITANQFEDLERKDRRNAVEITNNFFLSNDIEKIFVAYIEIIYQVRCSLFHGSLDPIKKDNEYLIKFIYLTLQQLMEDI